MNDLRIKGFFFGMVLISGMFFPMVMLFKKLLI